MDFPAEGLCSSLTAMKTSSPLSLLFSGVKGLLSRDLLGLLCFLLELVGDLFDLFRSLFLELLDLLLLDLDFLFDLSFISWLQSSALCFLWAMQGLDSFYLLFLLSPRLSGVEQPLPSLRELQRAQVLEEVVPLTLEW